MANERDVWHDVDEHSPYTTQSRARIELSMLCQELSDSARAFVRIYGRADAGTVEDAARLHAQADYVLSRAVIAAREEGTSWEDIGVSLGVTKQSAHERFIGAERQWHDVLAQPDGVSATGQPYQRIPDAAKDPAYWAAKLDAWVRRHREPWDVDLDPDVRPVSDGLRHMDASTELLWLSDQRHRLLDKHFVPPPEQLTPLYEREAVLYDRLADGGVDPGHNREFAAQSRARAADLRTTASTSPNPQDTVGPAVSGPDNPAGSPRASRTERTVAMVDPQSRTQHLTDWLAKARHARGLRPDQPWPAWSTGELLAVALLLNDHEQLAAMDYTEDQALQRLRYDIGEPTAAAAGQVFALLREQLG